MTRADIGFLFAYNDWANDLTFTSLDPIAPDVWAKTIGGSFPSIRDTMAHLVSAEWVWMRRWLGESPRVRPSWIADATVPGLRERLLEIRRDQATFIDSLADSDIGRPLSVTRFDGESATLPLGQSLQHLVNHSTYHRGQIATLLRQVGMTPISTDLLLFRR